MILEEYDEAKIRRIIARDAREEGLAEGEAKGKAEGLAMADAKDRKRFQRLAAAGMDISTIADLMEVSEETVRKAVQEVHPEE